MSKKHLSRVIYLLLILAVLLFACSAKSVPETAAVVDQQKSASQTAAPSSTTIVEKTEMHKTATSQPAAVSTQVSSKDGMKMVFIPEGEFLMGSEKGSGEVDETPQLKVSLDAYWIDQTEITNAMYKKCVDEGTCTLPALTYSYTRDDYYGNPKYSDYPVIFVNLNQVKKYCRWAGRRLPTEAEWEKAARGTTGLTYPWGNESPTSTSANYLRINQDTNKVGSYPDGISPYGALDMAGNVSEWVSDWYGEYPDFSYVIENPTGAAAGDYRIIKGGSWIFSEFLIRSAERYWVNPWYAADDTGFRCALSAD